jgi:DNA repair protein RecN (Recombination protein N)
VLQQIRVKNYAVIDEAELELAAGLTVLTGETGAGKSILVDALRLVLADRADAAAVRHGSDRAEVTAVFELADRADVLGWLTEQDLDADGECVLRRVVGREGRSRAYINGSQVALQVLRSLGEMMVEIHGQHEHQSLTRRPVQRAILDAFGDHAAELAAVGEAAVNVTELRRSLESLRAAQADRDSRLELLRYQVNELEALDLAPGETAELAAEHRRLANTGRLAEGAGMALDLVYEDESGAAHARLARARSVVEPLADVDPALAGIVALLQQAEIEAAEAADELRRYLGGLETDPQRLDSVAGRLSGIGDLARKHGVEADALPQRLAALREELDALRNDTLTLESREKALGEALSAYRRAAAHLSERRRDTAGRLDEAVTAMMHQLGMPGGRFEVAVSIPDPDRVSVEGADQIEFTVAANPGQPPAPLARVASGGELSRISLAIQVVATDATPSCLVFDEVDAGIGGGVAEIVGRRLRQLAADRQVLCVTHLPQVASQSHHHIRVSKLTDGKSTRTTLVPLAEDEKVEELARMLGGVEITGTTRKHAREMIERAGGD